MVSPERNELQRSDSYSSRRRTNDRWLAEERRIRIHISGFMEPNVKLSHPERAN